MKKLGIIENQSAIDPHLVDAYAKLFDHPLSTSQIATLTALFNWSVPKDWQRISLECVLAQPRDPRILVVPLYFMDFSKILVWNVRGLNRKAHRDGVRQVISMSWPEVVCLQETKIANMTTTILLSTLGQDFNRHNTMPANGSRGGILIAWKSSCCEVVDMRADVYSAWVRFRNSLGRSGG